MQALANILARLRASGLQGRPQPPAPADYTNDEGVPVFSALGTDALPATSGTVPMDEWWKRIGRTVQPVASPIPSTLESIPEPNDLAFARMIGRAFVTPPSTESPFQASRNLTAAGHPQLGSWLENFMVSQSARAKNPTDPFSGQMGLAQWMHDRQAEQDAYEANRLKVGMGITKDLDAMTQARLTGDRAAELNASAVAENYAQSDKARREQVDATPFASSPQGIYDTRNGQITQPAPPKIDSDGNWRTVRVNGRVKQFNPQTGQYDIDLGEDKQGGETITPTAGANLLMRLSTQWTSLTKEAREMQRQSTMMNSGLDAAKRGDMAAGSQAVLVTFQKILDPNSVVRESEYARSGSGQSLLNRIQGAYEKLAIGGAGIPLDELQKFAALADEFVKNATASPNLINERKRMTGIATTYGINPEHVFGPESPLGTPAVRVQQNKSGSFRYSTDGGQTWHPGKPPQQ